MTNSPNTKAAHDKAGRNRIRAIGAPKFLGIGYGEAQTRISGECMFGVRYFLGDRTLREVAQDLDDTTELAMMMADCRHW